jgi:hypothetical protein
MIAIGDYLASCLLVDPPADRPLNEVEALILFL